MLKIRWRTQHSIPEQRAQAFRLSGAQGGDDNAAYIANRTSDRRQHRAGFQLLLSDSRRRRADGIVGQDNQGLEGTEWLNPLLQAKTACGSIRRDRQRRGDGRAGRVDPVPPPNDAQHDKFIQYVLYAQIRDGVVANRPTPAVRCWSKSTPARSRHGQLPVVQLQHHAGTPARHSQRATASNQPTVKPVVVMVGLEHVADTVLDTRRPGDGHD
ncbi:hypothetical protein M8494_11485 [Serratia ureilytica]